MFIVTHRKIFYALSALLVLGSFLAIGMFGFRPGIEFTGGTLVEVRYPAGRPAQADIRAELASIGLSDAAAQETGTENVLIRSKALSASEHDTLLSALSNGGLSSVEEVRLATVGPVIGKELRSKAGMSITLVILAIVLYVAFAFRGVSDPISSWVYGFVTIIALVHDVIIPTGAYVALGHYVLGAEIDVLFITAILTILGFSVHDTIVVFDRTRENLRKKIGKTFEETVGISVSQTFTRSINTSLTVLLVTLALYFVGGETTRNFALTLAIGVAVGTYSSIFLASPLLVTIAQWQDKRDRARRGK